MPSQDKELWEVVLDLLPKTGTDDRSISLLVGSLDMDREHILGYGDDSLSPYIQPHAEMMKVYKDIFERLTYDTVMAFRSRIENAKSVNGPIKDCGFD